MLFCIMTEMGTRRLGSERGGGILMRPVKTKGELCAPKVVYDEKK